MSYLVSIFLLYLTALSSFLRRDYGIASLFLLLIMWILFSGSLSNADYDNYNLLYDAVNKSGGGFHSSQFGFVFLIKIANHFGLVYNQFLMFVSLIGMVLISSTIYKFTDKPAVVYLLYFIFPFALDVVQVKHFCAMAIVVFSLKYLVANGNSAKYKYLCGILIATSIHYISIVFLPVVFIKNIKNNKLLILVAIFCTLIFVLDRSNLIQKYMVLFVAEDRIKGYFENRAKLGFVVQYAIQLSVLILLYFSRRNLIRKNRSSQFMEVVFKINLYLLILFPFYMINGTFERAFRIMYIPNFIVFSLAFSTFNIRNRILYLGLLLSMVVSLFMWFIFIYYSDSVFYPIFDDNYFFKAISGDQ